MAEVFSNSITRAVGIITSYSGSTIGAAGTSITVTANTGIGVSDLVDNTNFLAGTRVKQISGTTIYTDRLSTNTASATSQTVKFLGVTTAYTSAAADANNTTILNAGIVTANYFYGDISGATGGATGGIGIQSGGTVIGTGITMLNITGGGSTAWASSNVATIKLPDASSGVSIGMVIALS